MSGSYLKSIGKVLGSMDVHKYASIQICKYVSLQEYKKGLSRVSQGNFKDMHIYI